MKRDPCEILKRIHNYLVVHFKASTSELANSQRLTWRTARKYLKLLAYLGNERPVREVKIGKRTFFISTDPRTPQRHYPEESEFGSYRAKLTICLILLKKALQQHRKPDFINLVKADLNALIDEYNAKFEKNRNLTFPIPEWVKVKIHGATHGELGELIQTIRYAKLYSKMAQETGKRKEKRLTEFMPKQALWNMRIWEGFRSVHEQEDKFAVREATRTKTEVLKRLMNLGTSLESTYQSKWERLVRLRKREVVFEVEENSVLKMAVIGNIAVSLSWEGSKMKIKNDKLLLHSFIVYSPSISAPHQVAKIMSQIATIAKERYNISKVMVLEFPGMKSFSILS